MAKRHTERRPSAMRWRSSSTCPRALWLSWGCWRPVRPGREGGSRSGSGREDGAGSPVFAPASVYCNIPMICSSVNLVRFIVRPLQGPDSNRSQRRIRGGRSGSITLFSVESQGGQTCASIRRWLHRPSGRALSGMSLQKKLD
jgi:hypothetical protein